MQKALNKLDFLTDLHAVGGCVRDKMLGRDSDDVDLATADDPEVVVEKCRDRGVRVVTDVGMEHGTVLVLFDGDEFEVTTFRKDLLCDGRHAKVEFTDSLEEDLKRRDFTFNAMAMDSEGNLKDPFDGRKDLEEGVVRTVRDPLDRFHEDLLRVLRGLRFAARYNFDVGEDTRQAMEQVADKVLDNVSVERVVMELEKAFKDPQPSRFLRPMFDLGLLQELLPPMKGMDKLEQNPEHHPEGDVLTHVLNVVDRAPAEPTPRFVALFHDLGKTPTAEKVEGEEFCRFHGHASKGAELVDDLADRLKLPNDLRDKLKVCTKLHMHPLHAENQDAPVSDKQVRRFQKKAGERLDSLQTLAEADHGRGDSELFRELEEPVEQLLMGRHLIDQGHEPGEHFGDALDAAMQHQLDQGCTDLDCLYKQAEPHLND